MKPSDAYYEIHIETDRVDPTVLQTVCERQGFWSSTVTNEAGEERTLLTSRDPREEMAKERIRALAEVLLVWGVSLLRYKIEHCVVDSNIDDELCLLPETPKRHEGSWPMERS